ncbi:hypothetical protein [Streptomyces vinaceus]
MTLKEALKRKATVSGGGDGGDDSDGKGGNDNGGCGDGQGCGRK